jgi:hypothetical protein
MYDYAIVKPAELILRRWRKRENTEVGEPNEGTLYAYGNVTMKYPVQLINSNKNIKKVSKTIMLLANLYNKTKWQLTPP